MSELTNIVLISGSSNKNLTNAISEKLNKSLLNCDIKKFSNGEIMVKINESIRNKDIVIVQTGSQHETNNNVNDTLSNNVNDTLSYKQVLNTKQIIT